MEAELKPCPFCGATPLFVQRKVAGAYPFHVRCPVCEATAGGTAFQNNEYNAEQWNRRAKAALTLPECAVALIKGRLRYLDREKSLLERGMVAAAADHKALYDIRIEKVESEAKALRSLLPAPAGGEK